MKSSTPKTKLKLLALALLPLAVIAPQARAQQIYTAPYTFAAYAGGLSNPQGVAIDSAGNLYASTFTGQTIVKIDTSGNVTTLAGNGNVGVVNGNGASAEFSYPLAVAVDSAGNVYTADLSTAGQTIRKIDTAGNVTTVAGSSGSAGHVDGNGAAAEFDNPEGLAVDRAGNIYVGDSTDNSIRKIDTAGNVTTLAGPAAPGTAAGSADGQGNAASFNGPGGVAVDSAGNVYVADEGNDTIRKIDTAGNVTTVAGVAGAAGYTDGTGSTVRLRSPSNLAVDSAGNVYMSDQGNNAVRRLDILGSVTTLATGFNIPTGIAVDGADNFYVSEYSNARIVKGTASPAQTITFTSGSAYDFNGFAGGIPNPNGVTVDSGGNLYVAGFGDNLIYKVDTAGNLTTLAGNGSGAVVNGNGAAAEFFNPIAPAVDSAGNVFVADYSGNTIRRIDTAANVTTLAGGSQGSADGQGSAAQFYNPDGVAVDSADNVYVSDLQNDTIRKIDTAGNVVTWAGAAGNYGNSDGQGSAASFYQPQGLAVDHAGNVYVADQGNDTIRKIDTGANVTTVAGIPDVPGQADGNGGAATFHSPTGVAVDSAGNLYVTDQGNNTIRKIDPAGNVTTVGGVAGTIGSASGFGNAARFNIPDGIAVDSAGNLYVSEYSNNRVTKGTFYENALIMSWPGPATLQSATTVAGPWVAVPGSNSPFVVALPSDSPQNFYRIW